MLVFPIILSGCDLIAIAETGSGKTVGFLLPGILHINAQPKVREGEGPIMLILTPTRELAMQIEGLINILMVL
jgi:superfamily II DNA/RNA helicase